MVYDVLDFIFNCYAHATKYRLQMRRSKGNTKAASSVRRGARNYSGKHLARGWYPYLRPPTPRQGCPERKLVASIHDGEQTSFIRLSRAELPNPPCVGHTASCSDLWSGLLPASRPIGSIRP